MTLLIIDDRELLAAFNCLSSKVYVGLCEIWDKFAQTCLFSFWNEYVTSEQSRLTRAHGLNRRPALGLPNLKRQDFNSRIETGRRLTRPHLMQDWLLHSVYGTLYGQERTPELNGRLLLGEFAA